MRTKAAPVRPSPRHRGQRTVFDDEEAISLVVAALVAARAVNILK